MSVHGILLKSVTARGWMAFAMVSSQLTSPEKRFQKSLRMNQPDPRGKAFGAFPTAPNGSSPLASPSLRGGF